MVVVEVAVVDKCTNYHLPETPFFVCRYVFPVIGDQHHCRLPIYLPARLLQQASCKPSMATAHKDGPTKLERPTKCHTKPHQDIALPRGQKMRRNVARCMLKANCRRCVLGRLSPNRNSRLPVSLPSVCQCPRPPFADLRDLRLPMCVSSRLPTDVAAVCRYTCRKMFASL